MEILVSIYTHFTFKGSHATPHSVYTKTVRFQNTMFGIFKILIPHTSWTKILWRFQKFWSRKPLDFRFWYLGAIFRGVSKYQS